MSEVRLVILDAQREISGDVHGGVAKRVIAALSAEPETIDELDRAMARFAARPREGFLPRFRPGADDRPHDAGVVIVDLAARLVAHESTYLEPGPEGWVEYHDGESSTDVPLRYHLPDDWEFVSDVLSWRGRAESRRRVRLAQPPLDARAVLYGPPLVEFVARECLTEFSGRPAPADDAKREEVQAEHDLGRQIHAKWLTTPRDDLRRAAPHDVMLAKRPFIVWDLQDRAEQWSQMLRPAPPLGRESWAYRFGGFGTHEIVTYYDLVRAMVWFGRERVGQAPDAAGPSDKQTADLALQLAEFRDQWLDRPDPESGGRTPRRIIDNERVRMPEAISGEEMMIDEDCPLCQLQADMKQPGFWNLDGCNMDDDFAFSFHRRREEFDEEKRRDEEFHRRWEAEQAERKRLGVEEPAVWNSTFSAGADAAASPFLRLFTVGSFLCEIIAALKVPQAQVPMEERDLIDRLNRDYANLREVVHGPESGSSESLIQPVLDRMGESLAAVAESRPDLEARCQDLRDRLARFLAPPDDGDEDGYPGTGE